MKLKTAIKVLALGIMAYDTLAAETNGMNAPTCRNRVKCPGLLKNGQLKKGYKYTKGGKVVKV